MDGFEVRAYRAGDAQAVADLINAVFAAGGVRTGHAAAEVDAMVAHEVRDAATDTRLVVDGDGRLAGVALVPLPPPGGHRLELVGGVHPGHRGAGIGRELLAWQLERAAALHAEVAPDARWLGQVVAGRPDTSAIRLYERLGFAAERHFLKMTAPTASTPAVGPPGPVRLMGYTQSLESAVHALHSSAFRGLWGYQERDLEAWAAQTVRSATFRPELARVALAGDAVVGFVLPYDEDGAGRLYIGQVGTEPAWRRRGIAAALLADVLGAANAAGYTAASLDTDAANPTGAAGVYARVGFTVDEHLVAYVRPCRT
ncbi:GNAT family N-acetyltransferase [Dactylosporangium sp. CA-139066]|uniref:GNAT family N-acetyltransferase n=1 Tax=Dactylosporangium sp. CA-139066 TaxID=3239930 RepID=UPI003D8F2685